MAYSSTRQVLERCADGELKDYLKRQTKHYERCCRDAAQQMEESGRRPGEIPAMQKAMSRIGIAMRTAADSSRGNIAKLMYDGTNMGIVDIARTMNRTAGASQKTVDMAETLLTQEEKYADGLRKFL